MLATERNTRAAAATARSPSAQREAGQVSIASAPAQHLSIPDHELLRPIAAGAYGEVWLAKNALGTLRAVKIVRRDQHSSPESFRREFRGLQKFEPLSRTHDGLVDILTLGLLPNDTGFYYVMELADDFQNCSSRREEAQNSCSQPDQCPVTSPAAINAYIPHTLRADISYRGALPADEVISLARKLGAAVAYLHQDGLVHRDIKPSNIIFVAAEPKLADVGLVTDSSDNCSIVGTEGYLPPEGPGSPQADIFALGKVLYEAVTGRDRRDYPRLSENSRERPDAKTVSELNAVILKACAADVAQRYRGASAMLSDLALLERGGSVQNAQKWQWCFYYTSRAALAALLICLLSFALRFGFNQIRIPEHEPKLSDRPEALDAYVRARHLYEKNTGKDLNEAVELFNVAIEKDPRFAGAYAGLASTLAWSGLDGFRGDYSRAWDLAGQALELDSQLGEAHKVRGYLNCFSNNFAPGDREYQQALKFSPRDAEVHSWRAVSLMRTDKYPEALAELKTAQQLAPSSISINALLGAAYMVNDQYDLAIREFEKVVNMEGNAPSYAFRNLAELYEYNGEILKAIAIHEQRALIRAEDPAAVRAVYERLSAAYRKDGARAYWAEQISAVIPKGDPYLIARSYASLGDRENTLAWLKKVPSNTATQAWPKDPALDNFRHDPEFQAVLKRIGFPEKNSR